MNKKLKISGIVTILAILLVIAGLIVKDRLFTASSSIISIYDEADNMSAVYEDSKLIGTIKGEASLKRNMNHSACFVVSGEEAYILENSKLTKIGDELKCVVVANNANVAMFMDSKNVLYIYKDSKLSKVTDKNINMATLSGNGEYYSYSTDEAAYFGKDIDNEVEVKGVTITYMSEDGELIYAISFDKDGKKELDEGFGSYYFEGFAYSTGFYMTSGFDLLTVSESGETTVIKKDVGGINGLNSDGTEIMFYTADGTFVTVEGNETKAVTKDVVYSVYYYEKNRSSHGNYWAIDSFKDAVCEVSDITGESDSKAICLISKEYVAEPIVNNSYEFVSINEKMNHIFYKDSDSKLYRVDAKVGSKAKLLAEDVGLARVSPDGDNVYFVREFDSESYMLCRIEKGASEREVALVYNFFDIIVYNDECYIEANAIYHVKGDKVTELKELDGLKRFFIDYAARKTYGFDENTVYEIKGQEKKALDGNYKELVEFEYAY